MPKIKWGHEDINRRVAMAMRSQQMMGAGMNPVVQFMQGMKNKAQQMMQGKEPPMGGGAMP